MRTRMYPERDARICELYVGGGSQGAILSYAEIAAMVGIPTESGRSVVAGVIFRAGLKGRRTEVLPPAPLLPKGGYGKKPKVGDVYGLLMITEILGRMNNNARVRCRCVCGGTKDVYYGNLRSGRTRSCGHRGVFAS